MSTNTEVSFFALLAHLVLELFSVLAPIRNLGLGAHRDTGDGGRTLRKEPRCGVIAKLVHQRTKEQKGSRAMRRVRPNDRRRNQVSESLQKGLKIEDATCGTLMQLAAELVVQKAFE